MRDISSEELVKDHKKHANELSFIDGSKRLEVYHRLGYLPNRAEIIRRLSETFRSHSGEVFNQIRLNADAKVEEQKKAKANQLTEEKQKKAKERFNLLLKEYEEQAKKEAEKLKDVFSHLSHAVDTEGNIPISSGTFLEAIREGKKYFRNIETHPQLVSPEFLSVTKNLSALHIEHAVFNHPLDFSHCNLTKTHAVGAHFQELILSNANARGVDFRHAEIKVLVTNYKTKLKGSKFSLVKRDETAKKILKFSLVKRDETAKKILKFLLVKRDERVKIGVFEHHLSDNKTIRVEEGKVSLCGHNYDSHEKFLQAFEEKYKAQGFGFGDQTKWSESMLSKERIQALLLHTMRDPNSRTLRTIKAMALDRAEECIDRILNSSQFLERFKDAYSKKSGFGNQLKKLEKISDNKEKIKALFAHAKKDTKSRTFRILFELIEAQQNSNDEATKNDGVKNASEKSATPSSDEHRTRATSVHENPRSGSFSSFHVGSVRGVSYQHPLLRKTQEDLLKKKEVEFQKHKEFLKESFKSLNDFIDSDTVNALKYYQALKNDGYDLSDIDRLLQENIYPGILRLKIKPSGAKALDPKAKENLIQIFELSSLPEEIKKILGDSASASRSTTPAVTNTPQALFSVNGQRRLSIKENREKYSIAWVKAPLAVLANVDVRAKEFLLDVTEKMKAHAHIDEPNRTYLEKQYYVEVLFEKQKDDDLKIEINSLCLFPEIVAKIPLKILHATGKITSELFSAVSEKMKDHQDTVEPDRTCIEKQYLIAVLMEQGKYSDAEREAAHLRSAWPLFSFQEDQHHVFENSFPLIKKKIVDDLASDLEDLTVDAKIEKFTTAMKSVHSVLSALILPTKFDFVDAQRLYSRCLFDREKFVKPIINGIKITALLRRIIPGLVKLAKITEDDLKLLFSYRDQPYFWVGEVAEKDKLLQNLSRKEQSSLLCNAIEPFLRCSCVFELDRKPAAAIEQKDLQVFKLGLLGIDHLFKDIKEILDPLFSYKKIATALSAENAEKIQQPKYNRVKYDEALKIKKNLKETKESIMGCQDFMRIDSLHLSADVNEMRESYQQERIDVKESLLSINQIKEVIFDKLQQTLIDALKAIGEKNGTHFIGLLQGVRHNLSELEKLWKEKIDARIQKKAFVTSNADSLSPRSPGLLGSPRLPKQKTPRPDSVVPLFGMR